MRKLYETRRRLFWKLMILMAECVVLTWMMAARIRAEETPPAETGIEESRPAEPGIQTEPGEAQTGGFENGFQSAEAPERLVFFVDDAERYEGMSRSYRNGYVPARNGRTVRIILPLLSEGTAKGSKIRILPDLGDAESCPFVMRNYQMTVHQKPAETLSGEEKEVYLVKLSLRLQKTWTPGVYPVTLRLKALSRSGEEVEQEFRVYVTLRKTAAERKAEQKAAAAAAAAEAQAAADDGYSGGDSGSYGGYDGGGGDTQETKPDSQPVILVTEYHTEPAELMAGDAFTLVFTLKNTSQKKAVQNMTVALSSTEAGFLAELPGETLFADRLQAGEERVFSIPCRTQPETSEGMFDLNLQLSYDNAEAQTLSSSGVLRLTVRQTVRAELGPPLLPASVRSGNTEEVTVQVSNIGRGQIRNARLVLDAPGLTLAGDSYLGELEGGTSRNAELKFFIRTLQQNSDGSENRSSYEKYGDTTGTLTLLYEDSEGAEYREEARVTTKILPMEITRTQTPVVSEQTERDIRQWQVAVALASGLLLAILFSLLQAAGRKIRRIRKSG